MVDFTSRNRVHGFSYQVLERRNPVPGNYRDIYRETAYSCFSTPRPTPHDCRVRAARDATEGHDWAAWLLSHGMRISYESARELHFKKVARDPLLREPEKLLFCTGARGEGKGEFEYPRAVVADSKGDILVCDSHNGRVQRFNCAGLYLNEFGIDGNARGELSRPVGLALMPNDDIVVADSGNSRIQVFRPNGRLKHVFNTKFIPRYVAVDSSNNYVVSTAERTIEIYDQGRELLQCFQLPYVPTRKRSLHYPIAVTDKQEIIVCDIDRKTVLILDYNGQILNSWKPEPAAEGLGVSMISIALAPTGQLIICDGLNHTISLYSHRGQFINYILRPTDQVGAIQACGISPEGHILVVEAACNGPHCLKIFRYGACECHRSKGGTSKRTTPAPPSRGSTARF